MKQFLKDWMLVISMLTGILGYFIYISIPALDCTHAAANRIVGTLQPTLIFAMLFLTFCKVDLSHIRLCRWHLWLLLVQGGMFTAIAVILILLPQSGLRVVLEGAMLCLICPTATASAVVTRKLGGDINHITTYIILINILVSLLVPVLAPYVHPDGAMSILTATILIMSQVFPLLLMPLGAALIVRYFMPRLHRILTSVPDLAFYLWAVALALAIAVSVRSLLHTHVSVETQLWLVAVSLLCCVLQFWAGRRIGSRYHDQITAGQALGQKNTVFVIWLGYTFFTPVTAIVGGFYSIWHNVINTYQLYRHEHRELKQVSKI